GQVEGGQVGQQVRPLVAAGIDVVRAVRRVGLTAGLGRALAPEVLDLGVDAVFAPAEVVAFLVIGGLPAVDHRAGHIHGQLRVFAERTVDAAPTRLGRQIDLRADLHGDAQ